MERFDDPLPRIISRMFKVMRSAGGVGLAAVQVGLDMRMFVASPTGEDDDRRVYVNPRIVETDGKAELEEGCLSVPGLRCKIKRAKKVTIEAFDPTGQPIRETGEDLLARIFQHEIDHLDGVLIADRMGTVAELTNRRLLRELEEKYVQKEKG